jgi:hypothetical protein
MSDAQAPRLHEDSELFRAALNFTERDTGFSARLIEKDYFCSVLLADLHDPFEQGLVFKGGTSLSKVHTEFYRLSEALDFVVSMPVDSSRADRRVAISPLKTHLSRLSARVVCFEQAEPLSGSNMSKQYIGRFTYQSFVTGQRESIKVEVGDHQLLALVGKKLAVTGNEPVDISESKLATLRRQLVGQLQPVLRAGDFEQFDLERAYRTVQELANQL